MNLVREERFHMSFNAGGTTRRIMAGSTDRVRTELERKFQSPIDVMLDPSLLAANTSLERLQRSGVFESQKQATLTQQPSQPRLGDLYIPTSFREIIGDSHLVEHRDTNVWQFFRGQSIESDHDRILDVLKEYDIQQFETEGLEPTIDWEAGLDTEYNTQLQEILLEECSFLEAGGIILSRTSDFLEVLRDGGIPVFDLGNAELQLDLQSTLEELSYPGEVRFCIFGVTNPGACLNAFMNNVLSHPPSLVLYQLGG